MERDIRAGIRLLQSVDEDIVLALDRIFAQESFGRLVEALREAMLAGRRIFFTGCGATGRLSILLEAAWREFWRTPHRGANEVVRPRRTIQGEQDARLRGPVRQRHGGRRFRLIKSVEGFEDFPDFGRHQLKEAGVRQGDVVVAITEGGETAVVIGTAWQGLDVGARVFFVYNNPTDLLRRRPAVARGHLTSRIQKLDRRPGRWRSPAQPGCRTTTELLVVGGL
jgi:N-acetylmuramic acid 6-phosphate etherase